MRRKGSVSFLSAISFLGAVFLSGPPASAEDPVPLRVSATLEDLKFGKITPDSILGGQVAVEPASGTKQTLGGAFDLGGFHTRARLEIQGEPGRQFVITLPDQISVPGPNGGSVTLSHFQSYPSDIGTLRPDGRATVYVGATAQFQPGQPSGVYRATVDVFVDYLP